MTIYAIFLCGTLMNMGHMQTVCNPASNMAFATIAQCNQYRTAHQLRPSPANPIQQGLFVCMKRTMSFVNPAR